MATTQVTFEPPRGRMPTLQFVPPAELQVDASYRRSTEGGDSQALIRRIAKAWNWSLCQPLVVSRRVEGEAEELFVIDGQHRLEAAKLRGDIAQLPCVIAAYRTAADEAADFVQLNRQRRPLAKLEVFRAAVASGEEEACAILAAMRDAGLTPATTNHNGSWKPGMVSNIAGIEAAWRRYGPAATKLALEVHARAWAGQVLQYAGTLFGGIVAICADEIRQRTPSQVRIAKLAAVLGRKSQAEWRAEILRLRIEEPLAIDTASAKVLMSAWSEQSEQPLQPAPVARPAVCASPVTRAPSKAGIFDPDGIGDGKAWCAQCDERVSQGRVRACKSPFCKLGSVS